jgi:hypothetical protein
MPSNHLAMIPNELLKFRERYRLHQGANFCKLWCHSGLTLCLFWNIIATTAAWIKGGGMAE